MGASLPNPYRCTPSYGAWIENLLGSNLPGLLLVVFAAGLWRALGRRRSARIGSLLIAVVGVGAFLS